MKTRRIKTTMKHLIAATMLLLAVSNNAMAWSQKDVRPYAEDICSEHTGDDRAHEKERRACIADILKNPRKSCGDYAGTDMPWCKQPWFLTLFVLTHTNASLAPSGKFTVHVAELFKTRAECLAKLRTIQKSPGLAYDIERDPAHGDETIGGFGIARVNGRCQSGPIGGE